MINFLFRNYGKCDKCFNCKCYSFMLQELKNAYVTDPRPGGPQTKYWKLYFTRDKYGFYLESDWLEAK